MSGFFSDSFRRKAVDVDYYMSMGEYAYGSLSRSEHDAFGEVFGELAAQIRGLHGRAGGRQRADDRRLPEVDVLRLYENGCAPAARATDNG